MKPLVIREKYSKYWPAVTVLSLLLAILFFISYQMIDNILWIGYLRLASFSFLAIAILSFFKLKDGQVEITISKDEGQLESVYKVRDNVIFDTYHPISDLYEIKIDQMPDKSLYNNFVKSDKCIRFRRKDGSVWYYFNEIESRVIPLSQSNAEKLMDYLKEVSKSDS